MRTQIMNDPHASAPWFEYYQVGGSRPIKQEICQFPYVIGRDEAADFSVDSSRVSRKHVMLDRQEGKYLLRDLDSTNGTYVNGKQISETEMTDGDVVVIADFELTFFSGNPLSRATATQVMTQPVDGRLTDVTDLILQVRRMHETLTHRSITSRFQPVVALQSETVFGYEVTRHTENLPGENRQAESIIEATECQLTERINLQHRLFAAEQSAILEERVHLFFGLQVSELNADYLPESLVRVAEATGRRHRIVAEIPESAVCDIPYFRQFVSELRKRDISIAYVGFCGGPGQIADWATVAPDFLKLASPLVKGVSRASGGFRMLKSLLAATHDLGCEMIATGVADAADAECLRELECPHAQGDYFGVPAPANSYSQPKPVLSTAGV
jgi:EAL domain-containing protein (putative c-di-GMP-specific phosphodiesterase class I)